MRFQPPNTTTGVELVTGCFTCHTVDLVIPAKGFDFKFQRWHRSDAILNNAFQFGWQYDWDERLTFDVYDGSVRYWGPAFRMSRFHPQPRMRPSPLRRLGSTAPWSSCPTAATG